MITRSAFEALFREFVRQHGTQEAAGKALGVSGHRISDVLGGHRQPSPRILAALGYRKVVMYERVDETQPS